MVESGGQFSGYFTAIHFLDTLISYATFDAIP